MASKMRMVYPYPKGRAFQNENEVPFKISKEFKLKDDVPCQKNNKTTPCLNQMSMLMSCLRENHFMEKECFSEVKEFQNCFYKSQSLKALGDGGTGSRDSHGSHKMSTRELSAIFKRFKK